jgi:hypothetical protein
MLFSENSFVAAVFVAAVFVLFLGQKLVHVVFESFKVLVIVRTLSLAAVFRLRTVVLARAVLVDVQVLAFRLVVRGQVRGGVSDVRMLGALAIAGDRVESAVSVIV